MMIKFKKLHQDATIPSHATAGSAGLDLFALEDTVIGYREVSLVRTGIAVAIPKGWCGLLMIRSGISSCKNRNGIEQHAALTNAVGLIDSDYRGEILLKMTCKSLDTELQIKKGDRIGQLCVVPYHLRGFEEVSELDDTTRGEGGFGHTGR